jgi:hypothetical protein
VSPGTELPQHEPSFIAIVISIMTLQESVNKRIPDGCFEDRGWLESHRMPSLLQAAAHRHLVEPSEAVGLVESSQLEEETPPREEHGIVRVIDLDRLARILEERDDNAEFSHRLAKVVDQHQVTAPLVDLRVQDPSAVGGYGKA